MNKLVALIAAHCFNIFSMTALFPSSSVLLYFCSSVVLFCCSSFCCSSVILFFYSSLLLLFCSSFLLFFCSSIDLSSFDAPSDHSFDITKPSFSSSNLCRASHFQLAGPTWIALLAHLQMKNSFNPLQKHLPTVLSRCL